MESTQEAFSMSNTSIMIDEMLLRAEIEDHPEEEIEYSVVDLNEILLDLNTRLMYTSWRRNIKDEHKQHLITIIKDKVEYFTSRRSELFNEMYQDSMYY